MPTEIKLSFKPLEEGGEYLSSANFTGDVAKKYNSQSPGLLYEWNGSKNIYHSELEALVEIYKMADSGAVLSVSGSKKSGEVAKDYIREKIVSYMENHPVDEMASELEGIIESLNKDGSKIDNDDITMIEELTGSYNFLYNQLAGKTEKIDKDACVDGCKDLVIEENGKVQINFGLVTTFREYENALDEVEIINLKNGSSLGYVSGLNIKSDKPSVKR